MSTKNDYCIFRDEDMIHPELDCVTFLSRIDYNTIPQPTGEDIALAIIVDAYAASKLLPEYKQRPVVVTCEGGITDINIYIPISKSDPFDEDVEIEDSYVGTAVMELTMLIRKNLDYILYIDKHLDNVMQSSIAHMRNTEGYTRMHLPNISMMRIDMLKEILPPTENIFLETENDMLS